MNGGVYTITCAVTNTVYCGATSNLASRINTHFEKLQSGAHPSKGMQKDYDRYGREVFIIRVLHQENDEIARAVLEAKALKQCIDSGNSYNVLISNAGRPKAPCGKCGETKRYNDYHCRKCYREYQRKYYHERKAKEKAT